MKKFQSNPEFSRPEAEMLAVMIPRFCDHPSTTAKALRSEKFYPYWYVSVECCNVDRIEIQAFIAGWDARSRCKI